MATKRTDELKNQVGSYFPPAEPKAEAVELALYRRQGAAGELIAMAEDGRAWRVPDQADGWTARAELPAPVDSRGLTRLGSTDERKARARIGADLGQPDQVTPAEPTPKRSTSGKGPATSGKGKAAAAAELDDGARDSQVVTYVTAAELAALAARAKADDRSVSYVARAAIRAYLGMN